MSCSPLSWKQRSVLTAQTVQALTLIEPNYLPLRRCSTFCFTQAACKTMKSSRSSRHIATLEQARAHVVASTHIKVPHDMRSTLESTACLLLEVGQKTYMTFYAPPHYIRCRAERSQPFFIRTSTSNGAPATNGTALHLRNGTTRGES